ncbi:hypothetical protein SAXI111661_12385 [Saccharomonospora xinjiangensis]|uniref:hypothetical protein n=1 Tax=Saccharomonospora xinjiangensis TaxID=75294 RepID=UPI001070629A|nr:hypothetical protein [Saccharomonospora xinjiangensis]QBQ58556.1 hypothetical protein EYD13_00830 [Saccharomonospora xinjiangensis]
MPVWEDEPAKSGGVGGAVAAMAASFNTKDVSSMASGAKEMLKSAKSGGFRVSEEAAKPIREVLQKHVEEVERMAHDFSLLALAPPALGHHDYGKRVAEFQLRATAVDPDSPAEVLKKLRQVLVDADKALEIAVQKYQEAEDAAASSVKSRQV